MALRTGRTPMLRFFLTVAIVWTWTAVAEDEASSFRIVATPPSRYVSLSGDLVVPYKYRFQDDDDDEVVSGDAVAELMDADETVASITFRPVPGGGKLVFRCGVVVRACQCTVNITVGKWTIEARSRHDRRIGLSPSSIRVEWPPIRLSTPPPRLETYTTDVTVSVESTGIACRPLRPPFSAHLELEYDSSSPLPNRSPRMPPPPTKTRVHTVDDLYGVVRDVTVGCAYFDRAGHYRFVLTVITSNDDDHVVVLAASETMTVDWSDEYRLQPQSRSVSASCRSETAVMSVAYRYPRCILDGDRIRLYGRKRSTRGNANADVVYLAESRVDKWSSSFTDGKGSFAHFSCRLFNDSFVEYCFKYVSVARRGAVSEVRSVCLPGHARRRHSGGGGGSDEASSAEDEDDDPDVDTAWSEWSRWSPCSATCGRGIRIRHRFCDSPQFEGSGLLCHGPATDTDECRATSPCTSGRIVPPTRSSVADGYPMPDGCLCGCGLNVTWSRPLFLASSGRRCNGTSTWTVTGSSGTVLRFAFLHFDLNETTECLQVRDGSRPSSELLLHETGSTVPNPVTSTSNRATLRYHRTNDRHNGAGFVARIEITTGAPAPTSVDSNGRRPSMSGVSTTLLCGVASLVLISVGLVVHHFVHAKSERRADARRSLLESPIDSPHGSPILDRDRRRRHWDWRRHDDDRRPTPALPVTSSTSVSDGSSSGHVRILGRQRCRRKTRRSVAYRRRSRCGRRRATLRPIDDSPVARSPEEYLRDSRLFRSSPSSSSSSVTSLVFATQNRLALNACGSGCPSVMMAMPSKVSPPLPLQPGMTRKLPVATVSPQPARIVSTKTYCAERLERLRREEADERSKKSAATAAAPDTAVPEAEADGSDAGFPTDETTSVDDDATVVASTATRRSSTIVASSMSEASLADAEFEYDYYDYGVHETPGSYFTRRTATSWLPPFVPRPPRQEYPLHDFGRTRRRDGRTTSTEDYDDDDPHRNSMITQESSADSDAMTASAVDVLPRSPSSQSRSTVDEAEAPDAASAAGKPIDTGSAVVGSNVVDAHK